MLAALSKTNPVLMIFEDVHWIDPTSLEVTDSALYPIVSQMERAAGFADAGFTV